MPHFYERRTYANAQERIMGQMTHGGRNMVLMAFLVVFALVIAIVVLASTFETHPEPASEPTELVEPTPDNGQIISDEQWTPEDYDYALAFDVSPDAFSHLADVKPNGVIKTFDCVIQSVDSNGITCVEPGGNYISLDAIGNPGDTIQVSAFLIFV